MALKTRSSRKPTDQEVAALADKLADKKYTGSVTTELADKPVQRSLALPKSLDLAISRASAENKLNGTGPQNVSAIIREAIEEYLDRRKNNF